MSTEIHICEGQILSGPLFSEPMQVETVRPNGPGVWVLGLVGQRSEQFRRVTLTTGDIANLSIADSALSYDGDGRLLRLALQAYSLGIAYEFDPYFGLSISREDPLPHQLEAVYEHLLKLPSVRFLLADDAGAGKTIMAGLLVRELKLRGLIERVLVVCPANLSFQWQRELKEKFDEKFLVLKGSDIRDQFGVNQWMEQKQIITSLDLAKRTEILPGLRQVHWDLVIVDEAHRMSARDETHKSQRYRLGELLRDSADHVLLLTATPHKGDPQNFTLFLQLLDRDAYADVKSIHEAMDRRHFPVVPFTNNWTDTGIAGFAADKVFVVQTLPKVVERCILMTTDPGDLVLDPTCGSGTTAYVAEQWGRRWITIDTSRVALALARARVMGARYPSHLLADSEDGRRKEAEVSGQAYVEKPTYGNVRQGFVYERVPHITLRAIANNTELDVIWEEYQPTVEAALAALNKTLRGHKTSSVHLHRPSPRPSPYRSFQCHRTSFCRVDGAANGRCFSMGHGASVPGTRPRPDLTERTSILASTVSGSSRSLPHRAPRGRIHLSKG